MLRSTALMCSVLAGVFSSGCDNEPKRYDVGGQVSFKGKPVKFGTISFRAQDGQTGAAQIVDGKYSIPAADGLTEGKYRVAISYPDPKIPRPSETEPPGEPLRSNEILPKKYNVATELSADINPAGDATATSFNLD